MLKLYSSFCLFALISLSSCTTSLNCELYNNTRKVVEVQHLIDGEKTSFTLSENNIININACSSLDRIIIKDIASYKYRMRTASSEYVYFSGFWLWKERKLRLQIEPNGSLFVLKKTDAFPASQADLSPQPDYFPLLPL